MKPAATTLMLVLLVAITANAQLSFLPQVGFEQVKTSVRVNDLPSFSPMGFANNFKANLRMDYRFKKGHGPYIGLGSAPGAMAFSFVDATNVLQILLLLHPLYSLNWKQDISTAQSQLILQRLLKKKL
jgi:hypothetical protein